MDRLVKRAKELIQQGIWEPDKLFEAIYPGSRKHYATVRRAIHIAKVS